MEFIDKSDIMKGIGPDTTADLLEKAMGHKYFKREGTPGNYKYYYTEEQYNKEKGKKTEKVEGSDIKVGQKYHSPAPEGGEAIDFVVKRIDNGKYTIETINKEGRKGEHTFDEKTIKELISESKPKNNKDKEFAKESVSESKNIRVGQEVKIPNNLTSDPLNKQGESGEISSINGGIVTVKFSDGQVGRYDKDVWGEETEEKKVENQKEKEFTKEGLKGKGDSNIERLKKELEDTKEKLLVHSNKLNRLSSYGSGSVFGQENYDDMSREEIRLRNEVQKLQKEIKSKEFAKEESEGEGKQMDLKSNWDKMSLRERDKFLESFKKDRPDDYKLLNTSIVNLSANNFEAWSEKQQDLLSSYYMFEFID